MEFREYWDSGDLIQAVGTRTTAPEGNYTAYTNSGDTILNWTGRALTIFRDSY